LFELISRAETWLTENDYPNPIIKWETDKWGEIPADFGRK
ncbi:MAG: ribonuclease H, partial [Bacteroidales bacterium]|nr:ribonuclease H [Bacteroidales bacterium]